MTAFKTWHVYCNGWCGSKSFALPPEVSVGTAGAVQKALTAAGWTTVRHPDSRSRIRPDHYCPDCKPADDPSEVAALLAGEGQPVPLAVVQAWTTGRRRHAAAWAVKSAKRREAGYAGAYGPWYIRREMLRAQLAPSPDAGQVAPVGRGDG